MKDRGQTVMQPGWDRRQWDLKAPSEQLSSGGQHGLQQEPGPQFPAFPAHHGGPGQGKATESRWKTDDLDPSPSYSHHPPSARAAPRSLSTPFVEGKAPPPCLRSADQISKPRTLVLQGCWNCNGQGSHDFMRHPTPNAHTHIRMSPDRRNCSQNLLKELPRLKTNRTTQNYNPGC